MPWPQWNVHRSLEIFWAPVRGNVLPAHNCVGSDGLRLYMRCSVTAGKGEIEKATVIEWVFMEDIIVSEVNGGSAYGQDMPSGDISVRRE